MAENSRIEWCDHTQNFWIGCTKVSSAANGGGGCDKCYAEVSTPSRTMKVGWGSGVPRHRTKASTWRMPKRWNNRHQKFFAVHGRRQRVFSLSLGDWLDNEVPIGWLVDMLEVVRTTLNLDWLLLSKRIGNLRKRLDAARDHAFNHRRDDLHQWISDWLSGKPPANVWIGATIVNQEEADRDIPKLLAAPAARRFLSMEPLLGPVDLTKKCHPWGVHGASAAMLSGIHWVIVGGESGPGARPMHPAWAGSLRDQCQAAGVPFFFKQWGEWGTASFNMSTGLPVFRKFPDFQTWVNKASTWVNGGICLDAAGKELKTGGDMALARDGNKFPVTIMHKVGKKAAGRLLDGRTWDEVPS